MASFNESKQAMDFLRGCVLNLNAKSDPTDYMAPDERHLSKMRGMFADPEALEEKIQKEGDPVIYAFHSVPVPETAGDLACGCSFLNPGKVGDEYFFTKGHFHTILDTGEVYYCLKGHGYMMLENPEGDWLALELTPGKVAYVPPRYAHRSINVSPDEQLVTFFVFRGDAGHDYGTIETKGYRKLLVERDGKPTIIDNPNWK